MSVMEANLVSNIIEKLNNFTNSLSFYCDFKNQIILCKDNKFSFITTNFHLQYFTNPSISLFPLLNREGDFIEKWDNVFEESIELKKEPILLFKYNTSDIFMMVNESFMTSLQFYYGRFTKPYLDYCDQQYDSIHYWILKFDDFLEFIDLDGLKIFLNNL